MMLGQDRWYCSIEMKPQKKWEIHDHFRNLEPSGMDARRQSHFLSISNLKDYCGENRYKNVSHKTYGSCRRSQNRRFIELSLAICLNLANSIRLTGNNNFCSINFKQLNLMTSYLKLLCELVRFLTNSWSKTGHARTVYGAHGWVIDYIILRESVWEQ